MNMNIFSNTLDPVSDAAWRVAKVFTFVTGPDVDRSVWTSPQYIAPHNNPAYFGRTAIRNIPDNQAAGYIPVVNNRAHLLLNSYNPSPQGVGNSFFGSQISTIEKWGLQNHSAVAFEARVKMPVGMPQGAVTSLFSYNLLSQNPFQHDEIDFEFASNWWAGQNEQINTNVYLNDDAGIDQVLSSSVNFSNEVLLHIIWNANQISWCINGVQVRQESQVPQSDMSLVLNFWVPDDRWSWAYNANLQPSTTPQPDWIYEVYSARVLTIG